MKTLLLTKTDLQEVVGRVGIDRLMDHLIERLAMAFASFDEESTEIPQRTGFHYERPVSGLIEWMPLLQKRSAVLMKVVGYHPSSPVSHQLPTILSTLSLHDTSSGHLKALVDGTFLTAMRTGAASAVASRLLARPDSSTLGLIGCGAQAVTQLHALSRVFDLREVLIYDTYEPAMDSFPGRMAGIVDDTLDMRPAPVQQLVEQADILCVATSVEVGRGPVFAPGASRPWLHINAVGSDFSGKLEVPRSVLEKSFVCPDDLEQARCEGECQQLTEQIGPVIVDVARRADDFRPYQTRPTVFDSTGWAPEDYVAITLILEYAREFGLGSEIEIECVSDDPRHPYEFLSTSLLSTRP